jgi:glycosyltransferase involved in cell wall biosynthesis
MSSHRRLPEIRNYAAAAHRRCASRYRRRPRIALVPALVREAEGADTRGPRHPRLADALLEDRRFKNLEVNHEELGLKAAEFWSVLGEAGEAFPDGWDSLEAARGEDVRYVYQAMVLAREARLRAISHLHAHFATAATTVARLAARFAGLPYTFSAHAKDIFHESVRRADLRRKLADAALTVTMSDYNLEYLRESYGPATEHMRRIYNGLDLERFPYQSPRERPPHIVGVGRLVEKKGFDDLIEACAINSLPPAPRAEAWPAREEGV